ncbi:MAG: hypothetical protein Q8936_24360 [Bacillota bacterium]|nr:hypothetical protein [Bacillota bacterium]
MNDIVISGISASVIIVLIINIIKSQIPKFDNKYAPAVAAGLGIIFSLVYQYSTGAAHFNVINAVITGIVVGLQAVGIHASGKTVLKSTAAVNSTVNNVVDEVVDSTVEKITGTTVANETINNVVNNVVDGAIDSVITNVANGIDKQINTPVAPVTPVPPAPVTSTPVAPVAPVANTPIANQPTNPTDDIKK